MQRSELLHCVDIDVARFKVLKKREQLPIITGSNLAVDHLDTHWRSYSLDDAFRLRLMLDLIGDSDGEPSLPPSEVVNIPSRVMSELVRISGCHPLAQDTGPDLWCGLIVFEEFQRDGSRNHFSRVFAATLDRVQDFVSLTKRGEKQPVNPIRIILANASRVARFVRQRAEEANIAEQFDNYRDWAK